MKRLLLFVALFFVTFAFAQRIEVVQFKAGKTVGEKLAAAQAQCTGVTPCVLTLAPEMAALTEGVLPARCANCLWMDFRATGKLKLNGSEVGTAFAPDSFYYVGPTSPGATVINKIDTAIALCGGLRCTVVIESTVGAGVPTTVPATVTIWDLRGGDRIGYRVGDATTYALGPRAFGVIRTFHNPATYDYAAQTIVANYTGAASTGLSNPQDALEVITEAAGYDNKTTPSAPLGAIDAVMSLAAGAYNIGEIRIYSAETGRSWPGGATGTIDKFTEYYAQAAQGKGGITIGQVIGFYGEAQTQGTANYTGWLDGNVVISEGGVDRPLLTLRRAGTDTADILQVVNSTTSAVIGRIKADGTCEGSFCLGGAGITTLAAATDVSIPAPVGGDVLCWNSGTSKWNACTPTGVTPVAAGTKALATALIASGACTAAQTASATGALTTDSLVTQFEGDVTGVTGYMPATTGGLSVFPYLTADTFNVKVCNRTAAGITPGAVTIRWKVIR
jgi:hypothetical protein